jgi:hypothetical protein
MVFGALLKKRNQHNDKNIMSNNIEALKKILDVVKNEFDTARSDDQKIGIANNDNRCMNDEPSKEPEAERPKQQRRGRPAIKGKEAQRRIAIVKAWQQAKGAGVTLASRPDSR